MCLGSIGVISETWQTNGLLMGRVRLADERDLEVCLVYTPDARAGSVVLVQLGFAVETLEPELAADTLAVREQAAKSWEKESGHHYSDTPYDRL